MWRLVRVNFYFNNQVRGIMFILQVINMTIIIRHATLIKVLPVSIIENTALNYNHLSRLKPTWDESCERNYLK